MSPRESLFEVTHVFISRNGTTLLLEREDWTTREHTWWVPGGLVEPGETALVGAVRETLEETGLTIEGLELLAFDDFTRADGRRQRDHFFAATCTDDLVRLSNEHVAYRWVDSATVPDECWPATDNSFQVIHRRGLFHRFVSGRPSA